MNKSLYLYRRMSPDPVKFIGLRRIPNFSGVLREEHTKSHINPLPLSNLMSSLCWRQFFFVFKSHIRSVRNLFDYMAHWLHCWLLAWWTMNFRSESLTLQQHRSPDKNRKNIYVKAVSVSKDAVCAKTQWRNFHCVDVPFDLFIEQRQHTKDIRFMSKVSRLCWLFRDKQTANTY